MLANRRLSSYLPLFLMLLLIVIVSFVFNFVGLSNFKAPPGADYGNYLTQVEILRGNDLRGWGLRHNPIFFILLDMFLRIFEEFTALKIVASLVFSVIAIPFFLFARKLSGSRLAAVICTWLCVFFLSNYEMISWGGTPNFLGFSFMLLTIFYFVDLINEPSKKNLLLSGFFLSLVVGTHILVTIYLLFSFLIFFIAITLAHRGIDKVRIKSLFLMTLVTVLFSLPYFSFYLGFFSNSSNEIVENTLLSIQIPQISFSNILVYWEIFVVTIVFALGLFALSKYVKEEHKNNGLLLCSLCLSPLLLALVTEHLFRWLYFLPIPLILCFGIYLRDLFFGVVWLFDNIKQSIIINAYKCVKNSRKTIYLLVICFIAIIGFQTTVMTILNFYPNTKVLLTAPQSYQFIKNDEIQAFKWIKENTAPNATLATSGHPNGNIGGGGNSYGWWIEGYCKRVCVFSGDLNYYSYQLERDEIRIANRIFAGSYSAEYENLRVTESYPSSTTNPEIAAFINNDYQDMLILNDAQHQLIFSPNENPEEYTPPAAFYSENRTSSIEYGDTWANFTITYEQPYFELNRSVIIGEMKSSVDVIFQILPKNSTLILFTVNLYALFDTSMEDYYEVSLSQALPNEDAHPQITLLETNGTLWRSTVWFENTRGSMPISSYSFKPLQDSLYVRIRIFIESPEEIEDTQTLNFYDSYELIQDLNIDYILINRYQRNEFQRFLYDSEHFTEEFQNDSIVIFKVN